ncbi:hypothetical protein GT347_03310 [Xylophilus rhododendri]|uniref:Uncharacterized protein n=1 Tax=Xylophilus rhododendri TaxID=2697032 RepID=A0A857J0I1_9BURK|nr:hypothetical protein [Xylophilus rhododendri]QHI97097.1 hypothetical protein GT347_03310 [Xylophilus rhododendri]
MNLSEKWRDSQPPPQPVRRRFRAQDFEDSVINERAEERKSRLYQASPAVAAPARMRPAAPDPGSWLSHAPQGKAIVHELRERRAAAEAVSSESDALPHQVEARGLRHRVGWMIGAAVIAVCALGAVAAYALPLSAVQ